MNSVLNETNTYNINGDISVFEVEIDQLIPDHKHDFLEIAYIKSGKVWHRVRGQKQLLQQGDYVIVDYETLHGYENIVGQPSIIINCLFKPQLIDKSLKNCKSLNQVLSSYLITFDFLQNINNFIYVFHDTNDVIIALEKINKELSEKNTGYIQIIRAFLLEVIIITMRKYKEINKELIFSNNSGSIDYLIQHANENYEKQISLAQLAQKVNISISHLSRLFKTTTGYNYSEYIQKVRIRHACRLLANSNKKVSEISNLVGYSDYKYFNQIFKKIMNCSPMQFRKTHYL